MVEIIPQLAGQLPKSAAEHEKISSGLKLTVWLQQPLCNAIGSDKVINMYHTYILVNFFSPNATENRLQNNIHGIGLCNHAQLPCVIFVYLSWFVLGSCS